MSAYKKDQKSLAKRDEINKQLWALQTEKEDYKETLGEIEEQIKALTAQRAEALETEAAERCLGSCPAEVERSKSARAHAEGLVEDVMALFAMGEQNMADAKEAGIHTPDMRRFNPAWDVADYLRFVFYPVFLKLGMTLVHIKKGTAPNLPDNMYCKPLDELTRQSHVQREVPLKQALRSEQGQIENDDQQKEVA